MRISIVKMRRVFFLSLLLCAADAFSLTQTIYYAQESVDGIAGRAFADYQAPEHLLNMSVYGWTQDGVAQSIADWNLGAFTGLQSPDPIESYQLGVAADWFGSAAVQMSGTESGCENHTWSIPGGSGYSYDLANCQLSYRWVEEDNIRPWRYEESNFKMSFLAKIPSAYFEGGAVGYIYASIWVADASGKGFWIQPQIFDSRGAPAEEFVGWDEATASAYIDTYYSAGNSGLTRYVTADLDSYPSTGATWNEWHWYGFSVNRGQLLAAISTINEQFGVGLSVNPEDYRLLLVTVQNEISWPKGNGHLGFSVSDLWVFEEH